MSSEAKVFANQRNAKRSTGPKSQEGKRKSAMNALKHGITAKHFVEEGENWIEFNDLVQRVCSEYPAQDELQRQQVKTLIDFFWKLERLRRYQTASLSYHSDIGQELELPRRMRDVKSECPFQVLERMDEYSGRIWREIYRILDDRQKRERRRSTQDNHLNIKTTQQEEARKTASLQPRSENNPTGGEHSRSRKAMQSPESDPPVTEISQSSPLRETALPERTMRVPAGHFGRRTVPG
jgi:hypothetical protein